MKPVLVVVVLPLVVGAILGAIGGLHQKLEYSSEDLSGKHSLD